MSKASIKDTVIYMHLNTELTPKEMATKLNANLNYCQLIISTYEHQELEKKVLRAKKTQIQRDKRLNEKNEAYHIHEMQYGKFEPNYTYEEVRTEYNIEGKSQTMFAVSRELRAKKKSRVKRRKV